MSLPAPPNSNLLFLSTTVKTASISITFRN
nr:MAG TPA: hypothetical protein [Caudoviricetes sp.]